MSGQVDTILRGRLPVFAASDIFAGAPVTIVPSATTSGVPAVVMCLSAAQKPLGVARDNYAAGQPVTVFDDFNVRRILPGAGASITAPAYIGVVGATTATHPISGVVGSQPLLGPVTDSGAAVGASATSVWAVGHAWENAAVGDQSAFRVEPRLLSGLVNA